MGNKEMPDDFDIGYYDGLYMFADPQQAKIPTHKYHADHIVQRLEREKAELVGAISGLIENHLHHADRQLLNQLDDIIQKHRDTK